MWCLHDMTAGSAFLAYATANDPLGYLLDVANFRRMLIWASGVEKIDISIAVSEAQPRSHVDERWYEKVAQRLEASGRFRVAALFFKPNMGRDFSSWFSGIEKLSHAKADDLVLMLNRSAHGPLTHDWYSQFARPFEAVPALGLCGSSINFEHNVHVQTYAWMTRMNVLTEISGEYPGKYALTRETAIFNGELALSRRIMGKGYQITSLAWPGEVFSQSRNADPSLPQYNISGNLENVPFRHVEGRDIKKARKSMIQRLKRKFEWAPL